MRKEYFERLDKADGLRPFKEVVDLKSGWFTTEFVLVLGSWVWAAGSLGRAQGVVLSLNNVESRSLVIIGRASRCNYKEDSYFSYGTLKYEQMASQGIDYNS